MLTPQFSTILPSQFFLIHDFDDFSYRHASSNLSAECNEGCGCSAAMYEPVCGFDGSIYFSPCHAGCSLQYQWNKGPMGPYKVMTSLLGARFDLFSYFTFVLFRNNWFK